MEKIYYGASVLPLLPPPPPDNDISVRANEMGQFSNSLQTQYWEGLGGEKKKKWRKQKDGENTRPTVNIGFASLWLCLYMCCLVWAFRCVRVDAVCAFCLPLPVCVCGVLCMLWAFLFFFFFFFWCVCALCINSAQSQADRQLPSEEPLSVSDWSS